MKKNNDHKSIITNVSVPTLRRLPMYLSFLKLLKNENIKFITAQEIARKLHTDPSQITKDLSGINIMGKTNVGYEVNKLISIIESFLGYNIHREAFIIGVGNLGTALMGFNEFYMEGMEIIKGFDVATEKIGKKINNKEVFNIDTIKEHFHKTPVDIGIITVPANQTQKIADILIKCGIKAIWNFSTVPISASDDVIIENTNIDSGLAMIKWKLNKNIPIIYKNRML